MVNTVNTKAHTQHAQKCDPVPNPLVPFPECSLTETAETIFKLLQEGLLNSDEIRHAEEWLERYRMDQGPIEVCKLSPTLEQIKVDPSRFRLATKEEMAEHIRTFRPEDRTSMTGLRLLVGRESNRVEEKADQEVIEDVVIGSVATTIPRSSHRPVEFHDETREAEEHE
jgi:hypothetical protein